jgi:hypothetical protein
MDKRDMDRAIATDFTRGLLGLGALHGEGCGFKNVFRAVFADKDGNVFRDTTFENLVTTQGANDMLDKYLAGSAYTAAWYMGLISSVDYAAIVAADTAASHAGWKEAGLANAPTYTGPRKTTAWGAAAARAKALSTGLVFTFTGAGTVKGCFLQSTAALDATTGVLLSAGLFSDGDQPVVAGNTLTVTYSMSLSA